MVVLLEGLSGKVANDENGDGFADIGYDMETALQNDFALRLGIQAPTIYIYIYLQLNQSYNRNLINIFAIRTNGNVQCVYHVGLWNNR